MWAIRRPAVLQNRDVFETYATTEKPKHNIQLQGDTGGVKDELLTARFDQLL